MDTNVNPPKIAILNSSLGITHRGGERVLLEVYEHLRAKTAVDNFSGGRVPGVTSTRIPAIEHDQWLARVLEIVTPSALHRLWRRAHLSALDIEQMSFNLRVAPRLLRGGYGLIITQADFWTCVICRLIRIFLQIPFITVSGGLTQSSREALNHGPNGHVVVNPEVEAELKEEFPAALIRFIPNGVDLNQFMPGPTTIDLRLERPVYLAVSACEPRKRIHLAIDAICRLGTGSLLLLGDGPLRDEWVEHGQRSLGKDRFDQRVVPLTRIADYYRACDVFTLPSENEPFGLVYLEAMACNLPAVAQDDLIRRFIVGNGGRVCDCSNVADYADALREASSTDYGNRPLDQARRFSWPEVMQQYDALIEDVTSGFRKAGRV